MDSGYGALVAGGANLLGVGLQNFFNERAAQKQMDFQERMSSTAYQRAMLDMEMAGLNPILAFSQGGASAPSGASAVHENLLGRTVSSAMDYKRNLAEIEKIKSDAAINNLIAKGLSAELPRKELNKDLDESPLGPIINFIDRVNPLKLFNIGVK